MNGTEQRARSLAVSRIEARMTDVEEVTEGLAGQLVAARDATGVVLEAVDRRIDGVHMSLSRRVDELSRRLDALTADRDQRIAAWEALTRWQRLRWLVLGHA